MGDNLYPCSYWFVYTSLMRTYTKNETFLKNIPDVTNYKIKKKKDDKFISSLNQQQTKGADHNKQDRIQIDLRLWCVIRFRELKAVHQRARLWSHSYVKNTYTWFEVRHHWWDVCCGVGLSQQVGCMALQMGLERRFRLIEHCDLPEGIASLSGSKNWSLKRCVFREFNSGNRPFPSLNRTLK